MLWLLQLGPERVLLGRYWSMLERLLCPVSDPCTLQFLRHFPNLHKLDMILVVEVSLLALEVVWVFLLQGIAEGWYKLLLSVDVGNASFVLLPVCKEQRLNTPHG